MTWPGHFIFLTLLIISMTSVLSQIGRPRCWYFYPCRGGGLCDVEQYFFPFWSGAAASLLCACLVSVQVSAP